MNPLAALLIVAFFAWMLYDMKAASKEAARRPADFEDPTEDFYNH